MNKQYVEENKESFQYLFELRDSGRVNMFGAGTYLQNERGLDRNKAREILSYWMTHFDDIATELGVTV